MIGGILFGAKGDCKRSENLMQWIGTRIVKILVTSVKPNGAGGLL